MDNMYNLKEIMTQIAATCDEQEEKLKSGLFCLLSFFILTFEYRSDVIKTVIYNNRKNFKRIIDQFQANLDDEDTVSLLQAIVNKLDNLVWDPQSPLLPNVKKKSLDRKRLIKSPEQIKEIMKIN